MKPIAISAGHYPEAKGAYNKTHNLWEYDICTNIASIVAIELQELNIPIVFVPTGALTKKIAFINKSDCLCAIEIHLNSASVIGSGTECLYYPRSERGKTLAQFCQTALVFNLSLRDRGLVARERLAFLSRTTCPSVITEALFLNNNVEVESYLLDDHGIKLIVNAHVKALQQYYQWRKK